MIFPKLKEKRVRLFAKGGAFGNTLQQTFDRPGTYLGLQYAPTKTEIPDLEGLNQLQQRKAAADAKLEAAKLQLKPDKEAMAKLQEKVDGLTGQTKHLFDKYLTRLNDYNSKYSSGSNDIFSPEARQELMALNNTIGYDEINKLKNNKDTVVKDYKLAQDKGLASAVYVNDKGNVLLRGADGNIVEHSAKDYYAQKNKNPKLAEQYRLMQNSDLHEYYQNNVDSDFKDFIPMSGQMNVSEAQQEIDKYFSGLGSQERKSVIESLNQAGLNLEGESIPTMDTITRANGGNSAAVKQALQLASRNLSAKARAALISDYISNNKDVSQIESLIGNRLVGESSKRLASSSESGTKKSFLPEHLTKDKEDAAGGLDFPTAIQDESTYSSVADTGGYDAKNSAGVPSAFKSSLQPASNKIVNRLPLGERPFFVLGDGSAWKFWDKSRSYDGSPVNDPSKVLAFDTKDPEKTAIFHKKNGTIPIVTGVVDKNGKPVSGKISPGNIVTTGSASTAGLPKGATAKLDANGKTYFEDEDKNKIYVQNVSASFYQQGEETYIVPDSRTESLLKYGKNMSMEKSAANHILPDGQLTPRASQLVSVLAAADPQTKALLDQKQSFLVNEKKKISRNDNAILKVENQINDLINELTDRFDLIKLNNRRSTPKETFTPNAATQERMYEMNAGDLTN